MNIETPTPRARRHQQRPIALEALFDGHHHAILAFFRRRGFSEGECEDLAQETFLKAHRSLQGYRGEAPVEHWLFRIASNTAKATLRFRSAARRAADEIPLENATATYQEAFAALEDPLRSLLSSERARQLTAAVDRLPARMRCCVQLLLQQDGRYRDIAETLRISEQTVKVQLLRARGQLKVLLNETPAEPEVNRRATKTIHKTTLNRSRCKPQRAI